MVFFGGEREVNNGTGLGGDGWIMDGLTKARITMAGQRFKPGGVVESGGGVKSTTVFGPKNPRLGKD